MGQPLPLFRLFSDKQYYFYNNFEKCPSSIQCWDSNPWPLDHESPPITTRPDVYVFWPSHFPFILDCKLVRSVCLLTAKMASLGKAAKSVAKMAEWKQINNSQFTYVQQSPRFDRIHLNLPKVSKRNFLLKVSFTLSCESDDDLR